MNHVKLQGCTLTMGAKKESSHLVVSTGAPDGADAPMESEQSPTEPEQSGLSEKLSGDTQWSVGS